MDLTDAVGTPGQAAAQSLETLASTAERPRWLRIVDPWDVAGHAAKTVLPTHTTPAMAHAAYYLVLAGFVAAEVIEPPIALLLGAGHLMLQSHNRVFQEVGAAVEEGA